MTFPPRLLVAVALGGAAGAVLRWAVGEMAGDGSGFPWPTFAVNVLGSTALAALDLVPAVRRSALASAALGPGLLGGFTTFSATSEQGRALLAAGDTLLATCYVLGTLAACVVAVTAVSLLRPRRGPAPAADAA